MYIISITIRNTYHIEKVHYEQELGEVFLIVFLSSEKSNFLISCTLYNYNPFIILPGHFLRLN